MLEKFERFARASSSWVANVGAALILATLAITFTDIISSKFFTWPVPGSVELAGFFQAIIIASAVALTQIHRQHIRVEIFMARLSKPIQATVDSIVSLVLVFLFIFVVWELVRYGISIQKTGQYSSDIRLPIHCFIYLTALALVPCCFVFLVEFLHSLRGIKKR